MLHFLKKKIRLYWHDLYYFLVPKSGVKFAMTCQDATAKIDLNDQTKTSLDKARVKLHVSLCQSCHNYYSFSQVLRRAVRKLIPAKKKVQSDVEELNKKLLKHYTVIK